jgi:hypothetical protein
VAGYVVPSLVCTVAYLLALRQSPACSLVVATALTVLITLGFATGLGVPLPRGMGAIRSLSYLLY